MNTHSLFSRLQSFIEKKRLINDGATLIIGLSGGPDSVCLVHLLSQMKNNKNLNLIVAHLDHEWRKTSKQDAQFCKDLAASYQLPFVCKTITDLNLSLKFNGSKEEIGRKARRYFFESLVKEYNADAITLAHHADDQMETFFIRMIRGASLAGLAGMKAKDGFYIRPLLEIKKDEILAYLKENNLSYVIDESNTSDEYLRNRIRNQMIPAFQAIDERAAQNFAATHAQIAHAEEFLQELAASTLAKLTDQNNALEIKLLLSLHPVVRNRVLIQWLITNKVPFTPSQGFLDEIVRFLEHPHAIQHTFYGKWTLHKEDHKLLIK